MKINEQTLAHIEALAKLTVDEHQRELTLKKIIGVLDMLDEVNMDDIADLEPLYHPLEIHQALRADNADADIDRDSIQAQAPQVADGLFLVPKVIE